MSAGRNGFASGESMSPRYPNTKNSNSMRKCRNHNTVKYGQNDRHGLFCEGLIHMICATNVNIEEPYHFSRRRGCPGKLEIRLGSFLGGIFLEAKLNHHHVYPSDMIRLLWKSTRQSVGGLQFDLTTVSVITPLVIFGAALRLANTR